MLVHRRSFPRNLLVADYLQKFAGIHLYSWVERGTVRVKRIAQEHNTVSRPGLKPRALTPGTSALTMRPPHLPSPPQCPTLVLITIIISLSSGNGK